jgi:hypothetical protein
MTTQTDLVVTASLEMAFTIFVLENFTGMEGFPALEKVDRLVDAIKASVAGIGPEGGASAEEVLNALFAKYEIAD